MERLRGKKNVYEQIVEEYARFIRTGALKEGEKLPSCRALAAQPAPSRSPSSLPCSGWRRPSSPAAPSACGRATTGSLAGAVVLGLVFAAVAINLREGGEAASAAQMLSVVSPFVA